MYNTPAELRDACVLDLCYSDEQLATHLPLTLAQLLSVPAADACWLIAGLLAPAQRREWSEASERRAKEYAAAAARYAAAAAAADAAAAAAADAAARYAAARYAADAAAADAADAAARYAAADAADAECAIAIRHGAQLLGIPE